MMNIDGLPGIVVPQPAPSAVIVNVPLSSGGTLRVAFDPTSRQLTVGPFGTTMGLPAQGTMSINGKSAEVRGFEVFVEGKKVAIPELEAAAKAYVAPTPRAPITPPSPPLRPSREPIAAPPRGRTVASGFASRPTAAGLKTPSELGQPPLIASLRRESWDSGRTPLLQNTPLAAEHWAAAVASFKWDSGRLEAVQALLTTNPGDAVTAETANNILATFSWPNSDEATQASAMLNARLA